jgi:hypothetical protein
MTISPVGAQLSILTDGRTDMKKLIVPFCNFVKASKNNDTALTLIRGSYVLCIMDSLESLVTARTSSKKNVFMARIKYYRFRIYIFVIQFTLHIVLQRKLVMIKWSFQNIKK